MTINRFVILLCAFVLLLGTNAHAVETEQDSLSHTLREPADTISSDTISGWDKFVNKLSNLNFLIVPVPGFSPETDWSFGVAGAYYFTCKGQDKLSDIGFDGAYTLNHQWNVNLTSTVYFGGNNRWFLYTHAGYKRYPDNYYGINSHFSQPPIPYSSDNLYLTLHPQYYVNKHWIVGANVDLYYDYAQGILNAERWTLNAEHRTLNAEHRTLNAEHKMAVPAGWNERVLLLGVGGIVSYDSRDLIYYPSRGMFMKLMGSYYPSLLNMAHQYAHVSLDFRHYVPLYKELILAYQFKGEWTIGESVPFQMLPSIGGTDVLRGIRKGQFRDDSYMALQAELRFPIWNIFRGTAFLSVGDVYNLHDWHWQTPKMGYGVGVRLAINKQKVNVRFDIAHDYVQGKYKEGSGYNYWTDGFSFYLTIKEAF